MAFPVFILAPAPGPDTTLFSIKPVLVTVNLNNPAGWILNPTA
jgi:hypothetical protein